MKDPMLLHVVPKVHKDANVKMPPNTALHVTNHAHHQKLKSWLTNQVVNVPESMLEHLSQMELALLVQPNTILKINVTKNVITMQKLLKLNLL